MANVNRIDSNRHRSIGKIQVLELYYNESVRTGRYDGLDCLLNHTRIAIKSNSNISLCFLSLCECWLLGEFADEGFVNPFSRSKVKNWMKGKNLPSKNQMKKIIKEQIPKMELAISNLNEQNKEEGELDG